MRLLPFLCVLSFSTCAGASSAAATNAVINSAIAVGVGAGRRANGDCFTVCPVGTTCNKKTGSCDELPCRGQCGFGEICDSSSAFHKCVPGKGVDLQIDTRPPPPAPEPVTPQ